MRSEYYSDGDLNEGHHDNEDEEYCSRNSSSRYINLHHLFSLISNYFNLFFFFFSIPLAFPPWLIALIVLVVLFTIAAIIGAIVFIRRRVVQRRNQRYEEDALAAMDSPNKFVR